MMSSALGIGPLVVVGLTAANVHNLWTITGIMRQAGDVPGELSTAAIGLMIAIIQCSLILGWCIVAAVIQGTLRWTGISGPQVTWRRTLEVTGFAQAPLAAWALAGAWFLHGAQLSSGADAAMVARARCLEAIAWMGATKLPATLASLLLLVVQLKRTVPLASYRRATLVLSPVIGGILLMTLLGDLLGGAVR